MNDKLPLRVNQETRDNRHIMSGLAQRAFHLARYDMSPDDAINVAIHRGLIVVDQAVNDDIKPNASSDAGLSGDICRKGGV